MKINRIFGQVIFAYFVYYLFVGLGATLLINHYFGEIYQDQTGRELKYSSAGINPFTLSVYVYDPVDVNSDGSVLWSAKEIRINPSLFGTLFRKGFVLDEVRINELYVHAKKMQDGQWAFADILNYIENRSSVPEQPDQKLEAAELPGITISNINFNAKFLGYSDWSRPEPFDANLENIDINLSDFSTLLEEGQPYHFIAADEAGGELEWRGTVSLLGATSSGRLDLRSISLLPAYRYMKSNVNFELHSALVDIGGNYKLDWKNPEDLQFSINDGRVALREVNLTPNDDTSSGLSLNSFVVNQISIDSKNKTVYSPIANLDGFGGTVSILEDGTTNFSKMMAVNKPVTNNQAQLQKTQASNKRDAKETPWSVALDSIKVGNTQFTFNDNSITPNFSAFIKEFGGSIDGISTTVDSEAVFNLAGTVDEYAPVTLIGKVALGKTPLTAQAAFDFKGIDLTSFSPYSGAFAGRRISKGLLSVGLNYQLKGDIVKGKNHVVIDQLTLGERVESPKIIDLPLQLAIALLTDKDGVIDLQVDVSGNAGDPNFSVGKVLFAAFKNLIVKAVTAPFRFLANLIGSDDDFEFVQFNPASAELSPSSKTQLGKLAEILLKRPQIKVGIVGLYGEKDIKHYKALSLLTKEKMDSLKPEDLHLHTENFSKAVKKQYTISFPEQPVAAVDKMYEQLINAEPMPELQLQQLAKVRALAVKQYLIITKQVDPQRVFLFLDEVKDQAEAVKLMVDFSE